MNIDLDTAKGLKLAVERLFDTQEGLLLIEYFEDASGKYRPTYNPEHPASIAIQAGRRELVSTIHNMHRLTAEQIVQVYKQ
jgi:hypothetical protein